METDQELDDAALLTCGINYCPESGDGSVGEGNSTVINPNLKTPPMYKIYTLAGIFLATSFLSSVIIAVFVDPLSRYCQVQEDKLIVLSAVICYTGTVSLIFSIHESNNSFLCTHRTCNRYSDQESYYYQYCDLCILIFKV